MDTEVLTTPPDSDLNRLGEEDQDGQAVSLSIKAARENSRRYDYAIQRGHVEYCIAARRLDNFYMGGGYQWDQALKYTMENAEGRLATEINEVIGAVNTAIGYQIGNRMDIQFVPRNKDANPQTAKVLSMVVKEILDNTKFRWHETQQFADGSIQQRGYVDCWLDTDDDLLPDFRVGTLDPMDVIPDPDAKSYDTADWLDVIVCRWLTQDEIRTRYGDAAATSVVEMCKQTQGDYGDGVGDDGVMRNRFGDRNTVASAVLTDNTDLRYRIIDRQHHIYDWSMVAIYPGGEFFGIEDVSADQLAAIQATPGVTIAKRQIKRVRWTVSAGDCCIRDAWSPFTRFTIIPYFPIFRRGRTRGMVDNAVSPQEVLNKAMSQVIHILNTNAHSGWIIAENSLTNMSAKDLEEKGGENGLVLEWNSATTLGAAAKPEKITPSPVPQGLMNLIAITKDNLKSVMGITEAMNPAALADNLSGESFKSQLYAAQQGMALPLDNLSRSRHTFGCLVLEFIQKFMSNERIVRVTQTTPMGIDQQQVAVNQVQPDGSILHDLTIGKYDVVISEQPTQLTFDTSEFEQLKDMAKEFGYKIPTELAVRYSNLSDKAEIAPILEQANNAAPDPVKEADAALKQANAQLSQANAQLAAAKLDLTKAQTEQAKVTTLYEATQGAAQAMAIPNVASTADSMLAAVGFESANQPIPTGQASGIPQAEPGLNPGKVPQKTTMPGVPPAALAGLHHNTDPEHPGLPVHPDIGAQAGIEGGKQ